MKAARFYEAGRPLQIEEVAMPEPGPGEVLVAVEAAGICGTDLHIALEGTIPPARTPITLGHEGGGRIATLGAGVEGWDVGDRVCFLPHAPCGQCWYCLNDRETLCPRTEIFGLHRDGTFAEAVVVPARCLVALPTAIPFEQGAILSDAVATAYHAVAVRAAVRPGKTVVVVGCGGVGHHAIWFARHQGAGRVIAVDVAAGPLRRALEAGADATIDAREEDVPRRVKTLTGGLGADLAVECVGRAETVTAALKCLRRGGRAVVVGVGPERVTLPPLQAFVGMDLALLGSMGSNRTDLEAVIAMVARGDMDLAGSVSATVLLAEINQALQRLAAQRGDDVRVVVAA
ncbi:MAG: zinc-binding dehydrogenase [Ardenticatenaceae bacterium]|nr:zinc-binding dehydrogenase [Ardenticatenaceae bacterium]